MKAIIGLLCGLVFGVGLAVSGMTDTAVVLGFLDITGQWNPDLAFVMGGAVLVTLVTFRFVLKSHPLLAGSFSLPSNSHIDGKLVMGAAIFGVGWGIYGYCPGPAISALAYSNVQTVSFVLAMLSGMALAGLVGRTAKRSG